VSAQGVPHVRGAKTGKSVGVGGLIAGQAQRSPQIRTNLQHTAADLSPPRGCEFENCNWGRGRSWGFSVALQALQSGQRTLIPAAGRG